MIDLPQSCEILDYFSTVVRFEPNSDRWGRACYLNVNCKLWVTYFQFFQKGVSVFLSFGTKIFWYEEEVVLRETYELRARLSINESHVENRDLYDFAESVCNASWHNLFNNQSLLASHPSRLEELRLHLNFLHLLLTSTLHMSFLAFLQLSLKMSCVLRYLTTDYLFLCQPVSVHESIVTLATRPLLLLESASPALLML